MLTLSLFTPQPISTSQSSIQPMSFADFNQADIPFEITTITGKILGIEVMKEALCNLVLKLNAKNGVFILKVATGDYRGAQLAHEYEMQNELVQTGADIPIAKPLAFAGSGDSHKYFLQEYLNGSTYEIDSSFTQTRLQNTANVLKAIHSNTFSEVDYEANLDNLLQIANSNMQSGMLDPEEFENHGTQAEVLHFLQKNKPTTGKLSLLHGDFRPKNLLWEGDKISGVLDWAFAMIGDPYYDLGIFLYYLDEETKNGFLRLYGMETVDKARLEYFDKLSKFLNV